MLKKKKKAIKNKKGRESKKVKGILKSTKPEFYFRLIDGSEIKNLLELVDSLDSMSEDVFHYHVNSQRNDFSNWIKDIFNKKDLADDISMKDNKLETEATILRHLVKELAR